MKSAALGMAITAAAALPEFSSVALDRRPAEEILEENRKKFVAGDMGEYSAGVKKALKTNRGRPPSGTDPPPSNAEIFERHRKHLATRGPKNLRHVMGNLKVP